jgi:hypothetical protein
MITETVFRILDSFHAQIKCTYSLDPLIEISAFDRTQVSRHMLPEDSSKFSP